MLKKLRHKKTAKKIWITLCILILPAFLFWGIGSVSRNRPKVTYSGKIFGKTVPYSEYKDALEATKNQAIMQFGDKFSEVQKQLNLEAQAWERLILLYEAKKRRIKVGDKEVVDFIRRYPFFQYNGKFDNRIYNQMLEYVFRTQSRVFEEQTRENIMLVKLYESLTKDIQLSEEEIRQVYAQENESISVSYIASVIANFIKEINPTEEEVKNYFFENSLDFKKPLTFNLEYIILDSEDKLKNAVSRVNKKEDFAKIAADLNIKIQETGFFSQIDPIPGLGWSPQIISILPNLKPGQYLPSVHMDKNYFILKLKEKKNPYIPEFSEIKDKVKEVFIESKAKEIAKDKIGLCLKKLEEEKTLGVKEADFLKIAKEFGLKSDSTGLFKYGSYIEGIGASDNLWLAAYNLKENDFSQVIEMPSGFYIIKNKSRISLDEKKFQEDKKELSQELLFQKKQKYFLNFVSELKKRAQSL
jgi:peptidyl-prolyl cis-trans isomerase D